MKTKSAGPPVFQRLTGVNFRDAGDIEFADTGVDQADLEPVSKERLAYLYVWCGSLVILDHVGKYLFDR